ncbi:response regulator [Pedobacter aquatilis]|uniref:response regulator n=1 Tax=Pedobacter aquatilis TaxID=351343 RepID=UPI00292EAEC9|nr:response regulator [Pedobacter aquatilis]
MKRILVVDDDPSILASTKTALEHEGFDVLAMADGENILTQVAAYRPDLVLLDFNIGNYGNGRKIGDQIKKHFNTSQIRLLLFSAGISDESELNRRHFRHFDGFIAKPYDLDAMVNKIHQLTDQQKV